jgi:hypothetical protein
MFKLEAVRALHGDALLLHYGTATAPKYALIDGGPATVWETNLQPCLAALRKNGRAVPLRWVALSHIDADHVVGLIAMFEELKSKLPHPERATAATASLFHNTPGPAAKQPHVASGAGTAEEPVRAAIDAEIARVASAVPLGIEVASFRQGATLANLATELLIARNPMDGARLLAGDELPAAIVAPLRVRVVSPTKTIMDRLIKEWEAELGEGGGIKVAAVEKRVENLSSLVLLVEDGTRKMLLTGDALDHDVIAGLKELKLLDADGTFTVDLLKLPHHGAEGNNHAELFACVKAKHYVISADGRYKNPDPPTLKLLVESEADREITIWLTNGPSEDGDYAEILDARFELLAELIDQHNASGITVRHPAPGDRSMVIPIKK